MTLTQTETRLIADALAAELAEMRREIAERISVMVSIVATAS